MYTNISAHQILAVELLPVTHVPDSQGIYWRRLQITDTKGDVLTLTLFAKTQTALEIQESADVQ